MRHGKELAMPDFETVEQAVTAIEAKDVEIGKMAAKNKELNPT